MGKLKCLLLCLLLAGCANQAPKEIKEEPPKILLDPGHYQTYNQAGNYSEGEQMLKLGKRVQEILKEDYGIEADLTRDTEDMWVNGWRNEEVDGTYVRWRGEMADGYDLFVSLHSNATGTGIKQPESLNRPMVFINQAGAKDEKALEIANAIGENLAAVYETYGMENGRFELATAIPLQQWTGKINDAKNEPGTVYVRIDEGEDYYGVLRGSNKYNVPGLLIEHGFHDVPAVRNAVMDGDMLEAWAQADAKAIARIL